MRVILDTNVLVAALIASGGPPHQLFEAFLNDRFTLITSDTQIEEFSRVTRYPAIRTRIHPAQAGRLLNAIRSLSVLLEKLHVRTCRAILTTTICLQWLRRATRTTWLPVTRQESS